MQGVPTINLFLLTLANVVFFLLRLFESPPPPSLLDTIDHAFLPSKNSPCIVPVAVRSWQNDPKSASSKHMLVLYIKRMDCNWFTYIFVLRFILTIISIKSTFWCITYSITYTITKYFLTVNVIRTVALMQITTIMAIKWADICITFWVTFSIPKLLPTFVRRTVLPW